MIWNPFKALPKSFLGVDIGTFSIKIVEISLLGKKKKLENYGEIKPEAFYEKPFRAFEKNTLTLSSQDVAQVISSILKEAKIKTKESCFSIPDFSSFFTTISLPSMSKEELSQAVKYEARQHIPLPLSEVTLDWQIIGEGKILLVAVPNEVIYQYQEIAKNSQLKLRAMEAEVFGLSRALVKNQTPVFLVDIGARSTTCSIVDQGVVKLSHSFDTSGNDFTDAIARGLNLDYSKAEELKKKRGLISTDQTDTRELLMPLIDLILNEIGKIHQNFLQTENKEIGKIILGGGSALLPGLKEYFSEQLEKPVEVANPFADFHYPPLLAQTLKKMGPSYSIAVGAALRSLE